MDETPAFTLFRVMTNNMIDRCLPLLYRNSTEWQYIYTEDVPIILKVWTKYDTEHNQPPHLHTLDDEDDLMMKQVIDGVLKGIHSFNGENRYGVPMAEASKRIVVQGNSVAF